MTGHGAVHKPQFCSEATIPAAATRHSQKTHQQWQFEPNNQPDPWA